MPSWAIRHASPSPAPEPAIMRRQGRAVTATLTAGDPMLAIRKAGLVLGLILASLIAFGLG